MEPPNTQGGVPNSAGMARTFSAPSPPTLCHTPLEATCHCPHPHPIPNHAHRQQRAYPFPQIPPPRLLVVDEEHLICPNRAPVRSLYRSPFTFNHRLSPPLPPVVPPQQVQNCHLAMPTQAAEVPPPVRWHLLPHRPCSPPPCAPQSDSWHVSCQRCHLSASLGLPPLCSPCGP